MRNEHRTQETGFYVTGAERRHAKTPRRSQASRRHRIRFESLISDCRSGMPRRREDEEGFIEFESLYTEKLDHPHTRK